MYQSLMNGYHASFASEDERDDSQRQHHHHHSPQLAAMATQPCFVSTPPMQKANPQDQDSPMIDDPMMYDSNTMMAALMSEDHVGLDSALLREMEELLASSREDTTQWNQFHLDSPSLTFPTPASPWSLNDSLARARDPRHQTASAEERQQLWQKQPHAESFLPHGAGWQNVPSTGLHTSIAVGEADDHDVEMDVTECPAQREADLKEMELLARQVKFLEAQRDFLEYKEALAATTDDETSLTLAPRHNAAVEKKRLADAQLHKQLLAGIAKQQLENLKYMEILLLQSPLNHYRTTLMTPMESFIHLTRDPAERRATLQALRTAKVDTVYNFINFQSRNIDLERHFFYLDTFEKFGKFYTVDFSISKLENTTVDEVVNIIYNHFVSTKDTIAQVLGSVENRDYFDGIDGEFLNARFVDRINLPKRKPGDKGFVVQESNTVYYVKSIGEATVLTCDYIDQDDLHPYRPSGRIRKDKTVGVIVEPYVDSQGKKCVMMKRYSFIKHHFKNIKPTPDLIQAISTKVILWGQAVRFCIAGRTDAGLRRPKFQPQLVERSAKVTELASSTSIASR